MAENPPIKRCDSLFVRFLKGGEMRIRVVAVMLAVLVFLAGCGKKESAGDTVASGGGDLPVISGAADFMVIIGDSVAYRQNVTAADSKGGSLTVEVDSGAVDVNTVGAYPVVYSAVDSEGNRAEVTVTLFVTEADSLAVSKLANEVWERITAGIDTNEFHSKEKTQVIFEYLGTLDYSAGTMAGGGEENFYANAYYGLKKGMGDCYVYAAVAEAMFGCAGVDSMTVSRVADGGPAHEWNLVKILGSWYHFDACPNDAVTDRQSQCVFDEVQAGELASLSFTRRGISNYYKYDHSLYPRVEGCTECEEEDPYSGVPHSVVPTVPKPDQPQ